MKNILLFFAFSLVLGACKTYNEEEIQGFDKQIQAYIKKNNLELTKSESGLYFQIHEEGEGKFLNPNALISTKYKGSLLNGKVFDERQEPVELTLKNLVSGWREVAHYLKPGGKATIIIPPHLGYGEQELPDVPKSSVLIFELEIVDAY